MLGYSYLENSMLTERELKTMEAYVAHGKIVMAIKHYRTCTGLGLNEGKREVDYYRSRSSWSLFTIKLLTVADVREELPTTDKVMPHGMRGSIDGLIQNLCEDMQDRDSDDYTHCRDIRCEDCALHSEFATNRDFLINIINLIDKA